MIRTHVTLYERIDYKDVYDTKGFYIRSIIWALDELNIYKKILGIDIERGRFPFKIRMI